MLGNRLSVLVSEPFSERKPKRSKRTNKMERQRAERMHAGKTPFRPGANPLWTPFRCPKVWGRSRPSPRNGDRALPACIQRSKQTRMRRRKDSEYREEDMPMPVLKAPPKQPKTTVVQLRLDDEARMKLTKYAEFLDCSPSYVVTEALRLVCNKDKQFQSWLSDQHTKTPELASKGEPLQLKLK